MQNVLFKNHEEKNTRIRIQDHTNPLIYEDHGSRFYQYMNVARTECLFHRMNEKHEN